MKNNKKLVLASGSPRPPKFSPKILVGKEEIFRWDRMYINVQGSTLNILNALNKLLEKFGISLI